MVTVPNTISFMRLPLALAFLYDNPTVRMLAILLAMLSDSLDGFLARRYRMTTKFGTLLDPLTDRIFVFVALVVFLSESRLNIWEVGSMLGRDVAIALFASYLLVSGKISHYKARALLCGKATTFLQFAVLLGLTFQATIPSGIFAIFLALGGLTFVELFFTQKKCTFHVNR